MSFIFRAYHAMARQRSGMSTKSGLPTAAVLRLRQHAAQAARRFLPQLSRRRLRRSRQNFPRHASRSHHHHPQVRHQDADLHRVEYKGYKANRAAMPEDLAQQIPYIRRALEAYRIPILELAGFEADDVIGTLARKAAAAKHPVYVVSSDKDMMQLVNDDVLILNPPKDNLICDAAKVEEILGVPPERVIDIMALRGDSVDNIPGAPGIGDKGSVEIIKRFGTVEQALDRANEVEKKTYRESLQNNRDTILFSKSMATIDTNVPVELNVEAMRAGEPDLDLLRQLFTELEFTSLLKELLPEVQVTETHYAEAHSAADVESIVLNSLPDAGALAIAVESEQKELLADTEEEVVEEEPQSGMLALTDDSSPVASPEPASRRIAISAASGSATIVKLDSADAQPRNCAIILATAAHAQGHSRLQIRDPRARFPRHPSARRAARSHALLLPARSHLLLAPPRRCCPAPLQSQAKLHTDLAEAADITGRLTIALREDVKQAGLTKLYEEMDLPLVPVLARMEQAGVKIDTAALAKMSSELEREIKPRP
jgi:DNA polymerase I